MNIIKKLQKENKILTEGIEEIQRYLRSSKFQGAENNFVNPQDILLRLQEIQNDIDRVPYEQ